MAYEFFKEDASAVKFGDNPGHSPVLLFAETKEFTVIAAAPSTGTVEGETVIITDDHTFPVGEGFKELTGYRDGIMIEGQASGDIGFQVEENVLKTFIVGDYAKLKEKVKNMKGKGFILLYRDPECNSLRLQQLGCKCDPAVLKNFKRMTGDKTKGGKKGIELEFSCAETPFDYEGLVTYKA